MEAQKPMLDLTLPEFYAATMAQAGVDVTPPDIAKLAEARGVDPTIAALAKQVYDQSILDGVGYDDPATRLEDAFKIAGAWLESRAVVEAEAVKIATALRVAAEKAVMQLIDEFDLDVEVDDALKIAAFSHLPPLDEEEKTATPGAGPATEAPPTPGQVAQQAAMSGMGPNERFHHTLAGLAKQNDAGENGVFPHVFHEHLGAQLAPHIDPKHHKALGEQWTNRYVAPEQQQTFLHHASTIAANSPNILTPDQIGRLAKDKTEGISDNKFLGFAQKNWKPLALGGTALGVGAMYFMHKKKQREEQERYRQMAARRAGMMQQQPQMAQ